MGGDWSGWRIRAGKLSGPGGVKLTPVTAREFARWVANAGERDVSLNRDATTPNHRAIDDCVRYALHRIAARTR